MTPQEESMLNDLIGRVEQTQLTEKDPEAEQLLNQRLARNPNALYILAQTLLVQKYALDQASAQINQLRAQQTQQLQPQPAHATSFLGSLLGHRDPAPPPPPAAPPPRAMARRPMATLRASLPAGWVRYTGRRPRAEGGASCGPPPPPRRASRRAHLPLRALNRCCMALVHSAGFGGEGNLGGAAPRGDRHQQLLR